MEYLRLFLFRGQPHQCGTQLMSSVPYTFVFESAEQELTLAQELGASYGLYKGEGFVAVVMDNGATLRLLELRSKV